MPMTVINVAVAVAVAEHSSPRSQWNSVVDSLCVPPPWSCSNNCSDPVLVLGRTLDLNQDV